MEGRCHTKTTDTPLPSQAEDVVGVPVPGVLSPPRSSNKSVGPVEEWRPDLRTVPVGKFHCTRGRRAE